MSAARTDIHSPSNIDLDVYTWVGCWDNYPDESDHFSSTNSDYYDDLGDIEADMIDGNYAAKGRCDHCGAGPLRWCVAYLNTMTGEVIVVGETCAAKLDLTGHEWELRQIKTRAENARNRKAIIAEYPALAPIVEDQSWTAHLYGKNAEAAVSILSTFSTRPASMSVKQIEHLIRLHGWAIENERKEAEKPEAGPVPSGDGRQTIEGEIISLKVKEDAYGSTMKMTVKLANGSRVWGTRPYALMDAQVGSTVRFDAEIVASDDETFGFIKRPTKATIII